MLAETKRQNFKRKVYGFGYDKPQLCDLEQIIDIGVTFSLSEKASIPSSSMGGGALPKKGYSLNGSNEVLGRRSSLLVRELQNGTAGRVLLRDQFSDSETYSSESPDSAFTKTEDS